MNDCVLVTVAGPDTPGITAKLAEVIATAEVPLLDVEQVVVHGQLTLCLLLDLHSSREAVLKDLLFTTKEMGLDLQFQVLPNKAPAHSRKRLAITALAEDIGAQGLAALAFSLSAKNANIETIQKLSEHNFNAIEIIVSVEGESDELRNDLLSATTTLGIDIAVQEENASRKSKRVVVLDMDSTLIQIEVIDELARMHGIADQVKAITHEAMEGNIDYEQSLVQRVALLEGLSEKDVLSLAERLPLTEGASDLVKVLKKLGYKTAVISGGFTFAANTLKRRLGLDYAYANELEIRNGKLTGKVVGAIVTPQRKADILRTIAQTEGADLSQTVAIGDGANDLTMLQTAGLGIAYRAKRKLREAADTSINTGGLDKMLYLLGYRSSDVDVLKG